jgi:hypothetical protein
VLPFSIFSAFPVRCFAFDMKKSLPVGNRKALITGIFERQEEWVAVFVFFSSTNSNTAATAYMTVKTRTGRTR